MQCPSRCFAEVGGDVGLGEAPAEEVEIKIVVIDEVDDTFVKPNARASTARAVVSLLN